MRQIITRRLFLLVASFIFHLLSSAQGKPIDVGKLNILFQNLQFEDAIAYLRSLEPVDSTNIEMVGYLAYSYSMAEDLGSADKYYQKLLEIDSNSISANQYLLKKYNYLNPELAKTFAQRLVILQPAKSAYLRNLGAILLRLNETDSAYKIYYRAYLLKPSDTKNILGITGILIEQRKFSKADSILEIGLSNDSMNIALVKMRMLSAYNAQDYISVIYFGRRLIGNENASSTALLQLAYSYYNLRRFTQCIETCEYMNNANLGGENVYYCEAKAYNKLRKYERSTELLKICLGLAISKKAEIYFYTLGENYEETKNYKESIKQYDTAFYLFRNPLMIYNCARLYDDKLKNKTMARKYYQKYFLIAKPESGEEKKVYEYVKSRLSDSN